MKFFLIGWFGAGNMGDEAILLSELLLLKKNFKDAEFTILSFDRQRTLQLTAAVTASPSIVQMGSKHRVLTSDFMALLKAFKKSDVVLIGGGGIFQDIYNRYPVPFFTIMALLAKLHGKLLVLYCLGIGPLSTSLGKSLSKLAANLADMVSVRDPESKELLMSLGVSRKIHVAADPVLLLEPAHDGASKSVMNKLAAQCGMGPAIGVCIQDLFDWGDDKRSVLAEILDTLIEQHNASVAFFVFGDYRDGWWTNDASDPVDIQASKKIISLMKHGALLISDKLTPQGIMATLGKMDMVISMRLHGLIMALSMGVPTVAVTYRQESKLSNLMHRVGMHDSIFHVSDLDRDRLLNRISYLLHNKQAVASGITKAVALLRSATEKCNTEMIAVLGSTGRS